MLKLLIVAGIALAATIDSAAAQTCSFTCINGQPTQPAGPPQGRLTLSSGTPVMTSSQSAATSFYYTPYIGNLVPIYNGSAFLATPFSELTNITTNSSTGNAGPAAVTSDQNYELFVWSNNGVVTLTRGPAWTSATARGSGAGTTELQRVNGFLTNAVAITNGPGANLGTYVGTVRSDGSSQINFVFGGTAAGGTAAVLGVWNAYNRVVVRGTIADSADSWVYNVAAIRQANGSNGMRASFVQGLQEDFFSAAYRAAGINTGSGLSWGVGLDSTTAFSGQIAFGTQNIVSMTAGAASAQVLGWHFMQALEYGGSPGGATYYGDAGTPTITQTGMHYDGPF